MRIVRDRSANLRWVSARELEVSGKAVVDIGLLGSGACPLVSLT
jgi:hypothetical protein